MSNPRSSSRVVRVAAALRRASAVGVVAGAAVIALTVGCGTTGGRVPLGRIDFLRDVKPILESRCLECHYDKLASTHAGLSLQTRKAAFTTGRNAPVIVPGNPDGSLLYQTLLLGHSHPIAMPPSPDKLWDDQLKILHKWIRQGAEWPEGEEGRLIPPQEWPADRSGSAS